MNRINLIFQYRPKWRTSERPVLSRRLSLNEIGETGQIIEENRLELFRE